MFKHKKVTDTSTNGDIQGKVAKYSKKVTNKNKKSICLTACNSTLECLQHLFEFCTYLNFTQFLEKGGDGMEWNFVAWTHAFFAWRIDILWQAKEHPGSGEAQRYLVQNPYIEKNQKLCTY